MNRTISIVAVLAGGAALALGCSHKGKEGGGEAPSSTEVKVVTTDEVHADAPFDKAFDKAVEAKVPLMPQAITFPMLKDQAVPAIRVRAVADKDWLAVRLQWDDKTKSNVLEVDKFTDAVAIELPLGDPEKTSPMMGDAQNPVYLCHWKAAWQRDVDEGRTDVQTLHPGYWADPYPFTQGGHPYPANEAFDTPNARRYMPGVAAGNPMSKLDRSWPVEELQAQGFSSLATQRFQDARGAGIWKDDTWTVVLAVPRHSTDPANPHLDPGTLKMAFAVWDGGAQNVGGRKQWASFVNVVLP